MDRVWTCGDGALAQRRNRAVNNRWIDFVVYVAGLSVLFSVVICFPCCGFTLIHMAHSFLPSLRAASVRNLLLSLTSSLGLRSAGRHVVVPPMPRFVHVESNARWADRSAEFSYMRRPPYVRKSHPNPPRPHTPSCPCTEMHVHLGRDLAISLDSGVVNSDTRTVAMSEHKIRLECLLEACG